MTKLLYTIMEHEGNTRDGYRVVKQTFTIVNKSLAYVLDNDDVDGTFDNDFPPSTTKSAALTTLRQRLVELEADCKALHQFIRAAEKTTSYDYTSINCGTKSDDDFDDDEEDADDFGYDSDFDDEDYEEDDMDDFEGSDGK